MILDFNDPAKNQVCLQNKWDDSGGKTRCKKVSSKVLDTALSDHKHLHKAKKKSNGFRFITNQQIMH